MVSKSQLKCSGHCFPVGESMNFLFNSDIVSLLIKTNMERESLMLLFWGALIVGERVVRLRRCGKWGGWWD